LVLKVKITKNDLNLCLELDFLLIGQGLAGTVLSYRLIKAGYKVHLVDKGEEGTSSKVAAGLYNPITGRRMVKTWQADILFGEIEPFYKELEEFLGQRFLHPTGIYRPFISYEEQNEWLAKSADPQYEAYINRVHSESKYPGLKDSFGGISLKKSGFLDIRKMLGCYLDWLKNENLITIRSFSETDLVKKIGFWEYEGFRVKNLVFSNGLQASSNSFFDWLPFIPVKGEILTVEQETRYPEIINRGIFRIDLGNGLARVGANYNKDDLSPRPTVAAKNEIMDKFNQLFNKNTIIIREQKVGIRPTTKDRRPFLGRHPELDNVFLFGGFGAKGVSLAPYFSIEMLKLLTLNEEPQKEVNINRFFKYI